MASFQDAAVHLSYAKGVLPDDLARALDDALRPRDVEVLRAKRAILARLGTGPADGEELVHVLHTEDGIRRQNEHGEHMDLTDRATVDCEDEHVRRERYRLAGRVALSELEAEGLLVGLQDRVGQNYVSVPVRRGGSSGGHRSSQPTPRIHAGAYTLSRRVRAEPGLEVLDPDVFTDGLASLPLDPRTRRCLEEALTSFRRGLYLASVALLGAVSEGAWYRAGELLRDQDAQLASALADDRTAKVQQRVAEIFRRHGLRSDVDDLLATAARLRDLRNYGVHPRAAESATQERFFTEQGAGLLLLDTYRYLSQLASAVGRVLSAPPAPKAPDK